jgi:hypothetical protein
VEFASVKVHANEVQVVLALDYDSESELEQK